MPEDRARRASILITEIEQDESLERHVALDILEQIKEVLDEAIEGLE